jgi:nucleotide-binding universal stress UspA family protein
MLAMSRILLPVDFSDRSIGAACYAKALACHFRSEVTLLHVVQPAAYPLGGMEMVTSVYEGLTDHAEEQLKTFLSDRFYGVPVNRVVLEGDPATNIVAYAQKQKFDLIVMPTHGYGPFRRFILGSTTAKVLHDTDCPVLTGVHMEETSTHIADTFNHILCAVDLGAHSRKVLCWAAQMAAEYSARLSVVNATPAIEVGGARYFDPDWRVTLEASAREEIEKLQQSLGSRGHAIVDSGPAPAVVANIARENHADLLVIGRSSAAGVFGRLRGNAYGIIRESPCPVVSI